MADNTVMLIQAALSCSRTQVKKYAEEIAREKCENGETETAEDIRRVLFSEKLTIEKRNPDVNLRDLVLTPGVAWNCVEIADEHKNAEVLKSAGLKPRNRILILGSDGNGKESVAEGIANEIGIPIVKVTYSDIGATSIDEMAGRLREIIEEAPKERCAIYFDRIDLGTKEQIKRLILFAIKDRIPENIVFIASALDEKSFERGLIGEFDVKIRIYAPEEKDFAEFLRRFEEKHGFSFGAEKGEIVRAYRPESFADMNELAEAVYRRCLIEGETADTAKILTREINMRK